MSPFAVRLPAGSARVRRWVLRAATFAVALCALASTTSERARAATGTAAFSGWVGTDDREPIAGARVLVTERFDVGPRDFSDAELRSAADRGVAATTDADGRYDAPGLSVDGTPRDVWVVARAPAMACSGTGSRPRLRNSRS